MVRVLADIFFLICFAHYTYRTSDRSRMQPSHTPQSTLTRHSLRTHTTHTAHKQTGRRFIPRQRGVMDVTSSFPQPSFTQSTANPSYSRADASSFSLASYQGPRSRAELRRVCGVGHCIALQALWHHHLVYAFAASPRHPVPSVLCPCTDTSLGG